MQLQLFGDEPTEETNVKSHMFFIHEANDEYKFPVIGFQNYDVDGKPYIPEQEFNMFAVSVLNAVARAMPDRQFKIDWNQDE